MSSIINHNIKGRKKPKDIFYTPKNLAIKHINMINSSEDDIWLDAFAGKKIYYNNYPKCKNKYWCEIQDKIDFFEFNKKIDIICTNPPYSIIDKVLQKSVSLNPRIISYLIGVNNFTAKRLEFMNNNGYGLTNLHMCKIFKWFGMSYILVFEKNKKNIMTFDRIVWR